MYETLSTYGHVYDEGQHMWRKLWMFFCTRESRFQERIKEQETNVILGDDLRKSARKEITYINWKI